MLPTHVYVTQKRRVGLSINNYRNWHFRTETQVKGIYKKMIRNLLIHNKVKSIKYKKLNFVFQLELKSNRRLDTVNFRSIVEKYLLDACVDYGLIEDDSWQYTGKTVTLPARINDKLTQNQFVVKIYGEEN